MELFRILLLVFLALFCLSVFPVFGDDDASNDGVDVEVEGDEEEVVKKEKGVPMPPPEIKWELVQEAENCRVRLTNDHSTGIHFVGSLASDGSVFYDSRENNEKDDWVSFPMGVGESIKGLELGLLGMCVGDIRKITVEPEMIKNGRWIFDPKDGKIPRDQKLIFEVEMMSMGPNYIKGLPNMFRVYDTNKDEILSHDEIKQYLIDEGTFGPDGPLVSKLAKEVIDKDDRDKDGSLLWSEFSGPKHDEL